MTARWWLVSIVFCFAVGAATAADDRSIVLVSTTSTENSGLLGEILPKFEADSGIRVKVVAQGTGQAIRTAERGDADVLLVHDRAREDKFVADGFGVARHEVMYNDFVLVGPEADPAAIAGMTDAVDAAQRIAKSASAFTSRGDESGTHAAELRIWRAAGIDPTLASGGWYRETGSGMGATLNTAAAMGAYAFTDRGTWLSFKNRDTLVLLVEGEPRLFNPYGVIVVDPARHAHVKAKLATRFVEWLLSPVGQHAIADFRVNGEVLFHPAKPPTGGDAGEAG